MIAYCFRSDYIRGILLFDPGLTHRSASQNFSSDSARKILGTGGHIFTHVRAQWLDVHHIRREAKYSPKTAVLAANQIFIQLLQTEGYAMSRDKL